MILLICGADTEKNGTDELIYNTEMVMDAEYKLLITRKGSGGEG